MADATISVGIDSGPAKRGATEVRRSLDDIKRSGKDTEGAFDRVSKSGDRMGASFGRLKTLAAGLAGVFAGLATAALARGFLDAARESENLEVRLKFLTGSAEGAAVAFREIKDFASTVPFTFQEIQNSSGSLLVAARNSEEFSKLLKITGDLAATTGLSFQQTSEQIQRAFSGGIASADLFRERGVSALLGFQQGATVSAEETRKKIFALWDDSTNKLRGASQEMATTWDGTMSMLSDKWFQFQLAVTGSALFEAMKAGFAEVNRQAGEAGDDIQKFGERVGLGLAQGLQAVVAFGSDLIQTVGPIVDSAWSVIQSLWEAWTSFANGVGVSPSVGFVGLILFGKAGLIFGTVVSIMTKVTGYLEEQLANFSNYIRGIYNDAVDFLGVGSKIDLIDVTKQREQRQAQLDSFRAQAAAMSGATNEKTGAAAAAQKIADAMQRAIDKFKEGKSSAQELAKTLVDFGSKTSGVSKEQQKATDSFEKFVRQLKAENDALKANIAGKKEQVPLIEAEAKLRESMGRDLLLKEREELERLVDENSRLNKTWDEQQKQVEELDRIWTNAADNIQNALADSIFAGKDLFESLKDTALSVAKQIAAAMIFQPIISPIIGAISGAGASSGIAPGGFGSIGVKSNGVLGIVGGGGSTGGLFSGLSGLLNGGLTSASLGNMGQDIAFSLGLGPTSSNLLSDALAYSPYGIIGSMLGGALGLGSGNGLIDTATSGLGSLAGGALGSTSFVTSSLGLGSLGGPVGAALGGLAGLAFGGLFGNDQPSDFFANQAIDLSNFSLGASSFNPDEFSQQNLDAAKGLAQSFTDIAQQIAAATGGTLPTDAYAKVGSRDGIIVGVGSGATLNGPNRGVSGSFANSEAGAQKALDFMVQALADQITGVQNEAFRRALSQGSTGEEILANVQFVSQYLGAVDDGTTALKDALQRINDSYDAQVAKAKELGLATDVLNQKRLEDIQATRDQYQAQLESVQQAGQNLIDQFFNQNLTPLTNFQSNIALGGLSALSPEQQFRAAQSQFRSLDLNTASASDIVSLGQSYLQEAQSYGASGPIFQDVFREVNSVLSDRIGFLQDSQAQAQAALGVTFQTSVQDQTTSLLSGLDDVRKQIEKLQKTIERAA